MLRFGGVGEAMQLGRRTRLDGWMSRRRTAGADRGELLVFTESTGG